MEMIETRLEGILGVMIPIVAIIGGLSLAFAMAYLKSKERMEMINRGMDVSKMEFPKRRRSPLRSAFTALGVGLGLLVAYVLDRTVLSGGDNVVIYFGCVFLFIGLGRVLSHLLEKNEPNQTEGIL